jgi:hypothetical protein
MQHKTGWETGCVEVLVAERVLLETLKPINAELLVNKFDI